MPLFVWNIKGLFPPYSSEHLQEKKEKKTGYPYLTPRKSPGPIIQTSLWLPRGPRWNDLFCFASLVPSVVRAGLSVPEHGNVMVARGDWRRYRPSGLWRDLRHHHCLVCDPQDTLTLAWLFYLFIHTSVENRNTDVYTSFVYTKDGSFSWFFMKVMLFVTSYTSFIRYRRKSTVYKVVTVKEYTVQPQRLIGVLN